MCLDSCKSLFYCFSFKYFIYSISLGLEESKESDVSSKRPSYFKVTTYPFCSTSLS